jgi:transposase
MLGPPKVRCLDRPIGESIEALVTADHFYRHLDATLDLSFVRTWVQELSAVNGRPSIDPVVFFRLQLVMFFEGIRSERQLLRVAADRLSPRWYLGYDFDEPLPDHSSLTRIRTRLGLPIFQRFFERVVELCQDAGLVWGKELIFDATKVRANANVDSLVPRWYAQARAHLTDLFTVVPGDETAAALVDAAEPTTNHAEAIRSDVASAGAVTEPASTRCALPFPGTPEEEQQLAEQNQAVWKLLDERCLDPTRPRSGSYQRISDYRVSRSDPDATPMSKGEAATLGYHDHYVVDGGTARIIPAALVTPSDVMDNTPMRDLLHRVRFRWHLHPRRAVGDSKYGTTENIRALEDAGIRAYVPLANFDERTPYFGASHFIYDPARDAYHCPAGQLLPRRRAKYTEEVTVYRATAATCNACPLKARCTASDQGRQLRRSFFAAYLERVRAYHDTPAYQTAMRKRAVWVEPLFGEAKDWHGLRRFRLRGLWKVNCEGALVAAGQNLKRWLTTTGWGRRHGPAGSLARSRRFSSPGI